MADVARLCRQANIRPEPGRVIVTRADGRVDVYPAATAREWSEALAWAARRAGELQEAEAARDPESATRLRVAVPERGSR